MPNKAGKDILITVITTVKNEQRHIRDLLDSLVEQEQPMEVIVVDAKSTDKTASIVKEYDDKYDFVHLYVDPGTRGESMNFGVEQAKGDVIAFIGGDCVAHPDWIKNIRKYYAKGAEILVGKVVMMGYHAFEDLERVELFHKGFDISYPGCATCYRTDIFREAGGFDPWFITAEDIDLNYRALDAGYTITVVDQNDDAPMIYHRARETVNSFFKQAFWNGYGRKQLTLKHGRLWANYSFKRMVIQKISFWKLMRLGIATLGYLKCKLFSRVPDHIKQKRKADALRKKGKEAVK